MDNVQKSRRTNFTVELITVASIIVIFLAVPQANVGDLWGFVGLYSLPKKGLYILTISSILVALSGKLLPRILRSGATQVSSFGKWNLVFIFFILPVILWTFRSKNLLLGDGLILIEKVHSGNIPISIESLTLWPIKLLSKLATLISGSPVLLSFRIFSILAGILYATGTFLYSRFLFNDKLSQIFAILAFWTLGVIQLFFGYIEKYSLPVALTPLLMFYAHKYIEEKKTIYPVIIIYLLICTLHLVALSLGPALLYLVYVKSERNPFYKFRHFVTLTSVLLVIIIGTIFRDQLNNHIFAGIYDSTNYPYTLSSLQFWFDAFNQLLLTSCFGVLLIILAILFQYRREKVSAANRTFLNFVLIGFCTTLFFSLVIDPKLGALRDWDLKCFYCVPFLCFILAFVKTKTNILQATPSLIASAVSFILFLIGPWIYFNFSPLSASLEISSKVFESDVHYSMKYDQGSRMRSLAILLTSAKVEGYGPGEKLMKSILKDSPSDEKAKDVLIYTYAKQNRFTEALVLSESLLKEFPQNSKYILQSAHLAILSGSPITGLNRLEKFDSSNSKNPIIVGIEAQANNLLGKRDIAETQFQYAFALGNRDYFFLQAYEEFLKKEGQVEMSAVVKARSDTLIYNAASYK